MEEVKGLPSEIISDILSRLPIEHLMRFKSVCKSWLCLMEDPLLAELHLHRSKNRPHHLILWDEYKLLLLDKDRDEGQKYMWKARDITLEYSWKYGEQEKKWDFDIVGSCNGLLCMVSCFSYESRSYLHSIFICNPITEECVVLPVGGMLHLECGTICFGVDSTGKYKVIQIFPDREDVIMGEIITLGESSWRKIAAVPYQDYSWYLVNGMLFMDGAFYCLNLDHKQILVFDLHDEKFCTIELPPSIEHHPSIKHNYSDLDLTSIKGCLVLHCRGREPFDIHIWFIEINKSKGIELNQYCHINVVGRGNDFYLVDQMLLFRVIDYHSYRRFPGDDVPEFLPIEEDLQLETVSHLSVYCLEKKQLMCVEVSGSIPKGFKAKDFVPSLVSPTIIDCGKSKKYASYTILSFNCHPHCSPPSD